MKVRTFGFEWQLPEYLDWDEFFEHLRGKAWREDGSILFGITKKDDHWIGLFLKIKDWKHYCEFRKGRNFQLGAREIEEGTAIADFNHFILSPETGRGLYHYYYTSSSLSYFSKFFGKIATKLNREIAKETSQRLKGSKGFGWAQIVRPDTLNEMLGEFKNIRSIEYQLATYHVEDPDMSPLVSDCKRKTGTLSFDRRETPVSRIVNSLRTPLNNNKFASLAVSGEGPSGEDVVVKLFDNYAKFDSADYNDIVTDINLTADNRDQGLVESPLIAKLFEVRERPHVKVLLDARA